MPKLTKTYVDKLSPPAKGALHVWDSELKGFGVCVSSTGVKSYVVQYRNADGVSRRMVVGKPSTLTPDQARKAAKKQLGAVAHGGDPVAERKAVRAGVTVAELCDWFLTEARAQRILSRNRRPIKPSSLRGDESRINEHIKPLIGGRPVRLITLGDMERLQADIIAGKSAASARRKGRGGNTKGGAGAACRSVGTLRAIFGHAVRWELIPKNPALGVRQVPLEKRDRRLSEEEIVRLGDAMRLSLEHAELPAGLAAVQLILMTGFRRMEALALRFEWVERDCVRFPDTKTGKQTRVLGATAAALIQDQRSSADQAYVFPSERSDGHLIGADLVLKRLCAIAELKGVTLHTLRHTFASVAADLGYTELTIAGLLGHAAQGVTQRYVHVDKALVTAANHVSSHMADLLGVHLTLPQSIVTDAPARVAVPADRVPGGQATPISQWKAPLPTPSIPPASPLTGAWCLKPIRSDTDYEAALDAYRALLAGSVSPGSPEAAYLEFLGHLISTYEEARRPSTPDQIDTLVDLLRLKGLTMADLGRVLGQSDAMDVLNRTKPLSADQISTIRGEWGIPAALLN